MRKWGILMLACAMLAGCASQGGGTPERPMEPGPFPENYEAIVNDWMRVRLKDPDSVKDLTITPPRPERRWVGLLNGSWLDAYWSCVRYNAKNSFGGYTGLAEYTFGFKD